MGRFALSPSHRVDQVVDCGLWNVDPVHFNGCAKVLDILEGTRIRCHPCLSRASQTWPVSMLAVHKLGCFQLPGILHRSLQAYDHEVKVVGTTMGLRILLQYLCESLHLCAIECEHLLVTMMACRQVETPMRMTSMQMNFPEKISDILCRNKLFGYANRLLRWLSVWTCWMWGSWADVVTHSLGCTA